MNPTEAKPTHPEGEEERLAEEYAIEHTRGYRLGVQPVCHPEFVKRKLAYIAGLREGKAQLAAAQEENARLKEMNRHRIGQGVELSAAQAENDRLRDTIARQEHTIGEAASCMEAHVEVIKYGSFDVSGLVCMAAKLRSEKESGKP